MKAIVVTDQTAGTAGMKLVERPEPQGKSLASLSGANYGDVVVQVHASGFTGDELSWPSTWIDRVNAPLSAKELARLRVSVERGRHFGVEECVKRTASELGLGHTVRPEGRLPKPRNWLRACFHGSSVLKCEAWDFSLFCRSQSFC